jgi:hypothetical protein
MAARDVVVTAVWTVTVVALHRAAVALFALVPLGAAVFVAVGVPSWRASRSRPRLAAAAPTPVLAPEPAPRHDTPRDTEVLATLMELQLIVRGEAWRVDVDDDVDAL